MSVGDTYLCLCLSPSTCGFPRVGGLEVDVPHVMCVDCFRLFVESRVSDRKLVTSREFDSYTVGCPMGCADSFIDPACFKVGEWNCFCSFGGRT